MNYPDICYKKTFLHQVIVRFDYANELSNEKAYYPEIEKVIYKYFPKKGKDQLIKLNSINFTVNPDNPEKSSASREFKTGIQKTYYTSDGKNKLIMSNSVMIFEINEYSSFEKLQEAINDIFPNFMYKTELIVNRAGIRYINIFDSNVIKIQKKYFQAEISSALTNKTSKVHDELNMIRSMHLTEYSVDNMHINFRYGMFNPEYPNRLVKNNFALDYDCFVQEAITSPAEVTSYIERGHRFIQALFESSITDALRKEMKNE